MNTKKTEIVVCNGKKERLSSYVASGGEGTVWKKSGYAYKVWHDPKEMRKKVPIEKIKELQAIKSKQVIKPFDILKSPKDGDIIGIKLKFVEGVPTCKLFTSGFRKKSNFDEKDSVTFVKNTQKAVSEVHASNCLIVDLNEMALISDYKDLTIPWFIDVESYQTKSFRATALMESVRDRKLDVDKKGRYIFTEFSDWFSWAIVAFQIYVGIHPYKGKHPSYAPKDWLKRMDDNISIFEKNVVLPNSCRPLSVIPKRQLEWFKSVFKNNERSIPPLPDEDFVAPQVQLVVIESNDTFETSIMGKYHEEVIFVYPYNGQNYVVTKNNLYATSHKSSPQNSFDKEDDKVLLCDSPLNHPIVCRLKRKSNNDKRCVEFEEAVSKKKIGSCETSDIMVRNGRLYMSLGENLCETKFLKNRNGNIIFTHKKICDYMPDSSKFFDGVVYQDLVGKPAFSIPYKSGYVFFKIIKELIGFRIIEAKSENEVLVVMAEKKGSYYRFVIVFDEKFSFYTVRCDDNVPLRDINFTKVNGGVCVLYKGNGKIEIFRDNDKIKEVEKSPFNSSMQLFNSNNKIFFINGNQIHSVKLIK